MARAVHALAVMWTRLPAALLCASLLTSTACHTTKTGAATGVGAAGGGIIGGAIGGVPGLLIGGTLGGLLGYTAGQAMEEEDRRRMAYAIEADRASRWTNPETGYRYRIEPTRSTMQDGRPCREFRLFAESEREAETVNGTACQRPDGSWELVRS